MSVPEAVVNNPVLSLPYYANILNKIGMYSIGIGVLLIGLVPLIRKWMGDVRQKQKYAVSEITHAGVPVELGGKITVRAYKICLHFHRKSLAFSCSENEAK